MSLLRETWRVIEIHFRTQSTTTKYGGNKKGGEKKEYLTMHFHVDPSWSSCSSMYILTLCSWSSWYQYISPSLSRPMGWRRMASASSSLIIFLNFRLSSNWHSQRYWKHEKVERLLKHQHMKRNNVWKSERERYASKALLFGPVPPQRAACLGQDQLHI